MPGLPGTSGFVGEFMVILASSARLLVRLPGRHTLIIGAAYTLWMVKRVVFGEVANDKVAKLQDVQRREALVLRRWRSRCSCWASGRSR